MYREQESDEDEEEKSATSGSASDLQAVMAALQLDAKAPNVDEVAGALRRSLNLGGQGDEALRVMADALVRWTIKETKSETDDGSGVSNETSPESFKENKATSEESRTVPVTAGVSGYASSSYTETTPTTSNATPMSFVRRNTPTPSASSRGRDRTLSRSQSARSRSHTPLGALFRQRSQTPDRTIADPSPGGSSKRSQSPFRRLFMRETSDNTPNVPFDERIPDAGVSASRPPVPPTPFRPMAGTAAETIVVDTPAAKSVHSFPSPPSTTGKTFCSPTESPSFQWSDSSPQSGHTMPSAPQHGFHAAHSFPVGPGSASQPLSGIPMPLFNVNFTKSKTERTRGSKLHRKTDKRLHKAGGPERSCTNVVTSQLPVRAVPQVPPVSATVPAIQQTLSADSSFQGATVPQVPPVSAAAPTIQQTFSADSSFPVACNTSTFSIHTHTVYTEQATPDEGMDVSPKNDVHPPPASDMGLQFSIGAGDKKTFSTVGRAKRNPRRLGSPSGRGVQRRPSQRAMSAIFPRTSPMTNTVSHGTRTNAFDMRMSPSDERSVGTSSSEVDYTGRRALVLSLREEARDAYTKHDFVSAVLKYTTALKVHVGDPTAFGEADDERAILLANRSAALLMLDAYELAAADCQEAFQFLSDRNMDGGKLATDSGLILKAKLLARLGKSLLKVGKLHEAEQSFYNTITIANAALALAKQQCVSGEAQQYERFLTQLITDAESGKIEVIRCREAVDGLHHCGSTSLQSPQSATATLRRNKMQALIFVNKALKFAPGSASFHEKKVTLLASLKRWRELAGHCERLAASTTKSDGIFEGDLAGKNPFPGASLAKSLEATFFDNDPVESSTKKLGVKAVAEAVLRLPHELLPLYLRALRLEERYSQGASAIDSLEKLVKLTEASSNHQSIRIQFAWLSRERDKISRTMAGKDGGDASFRNGNYELAAAQYTSCFAIDNERLPDAESDEVSNAGGRLHAILHCNRAACFMALKKYHEAVTDCTSALRIHSHYMKAMLRRGRCYHQLQRYEEATVEFTKWLELVEKAKNSPGDSELWTTPCIFDSPKEISDTDVEKVRKELSEVGRAKRMAEYTARSEASFRDSRRRWYEESFGRNDMGSAQQRREQWYNQQGTSSRRWDSFAGRSAKRDTKPGGQDTEPDQSQQRRPQQQYGFHYGSHERNGSSNRQEWQPQRSPVSNNVSDHYSVLDVGRNASESQIKRAYRQVRR